MRRAEEEMRQRKEEEKARKKEKTAKIQAYMKEWQKVKDDLQLEDHKVRGKCSLFLNKLFLVLQNGVFF